MRTIGLGIGLIACSLWADPIYSVPATDTGLYLYYSVHTNGSYTAHRNEYEFYTSESNPQGFQNTLTTALTGSTTLPGDSSRLAHVWLTIQRTTPGAATWLTAGGTPENIPVGISLGAAFFTVTVGSSSWLNLPVGGPIDLMQLDGFPESLASGLTISWLQSVTFSNINVDYKYPSKKSDLVYHMQDPYAGSVNFTLEYIPAEDPPAETPEPLTFFLAGGALLGIGFVTRRVRRRPFAPPE
jgi:hypothetical protein